VRVKIQTGTARIHLSLYPKNKKMNKKGTVQLFRA